MSKVKKVVLVFVLLILPMATLNAGTIFQDNFDLYSSGSNNNEVKATATKAGSPGNNTDAIRIPITE